MAAQFVPRGTWPLTVPLLAAIYVGAAKLGFEAAPAHAVVSSAWPPAGIAVAALVLLGWRMWPGVALGALVANATSGVPVAGALGIAFGNTLEAVVAAWLLQRADFRPSLERLRDVAALCGLGALVGTMVSAAIGVTSLWLSGAASVADLATLGLVWWSGDALGVLIVASAVLAWASASRRLATPARIGEALAVLMVLPVLTVLLFRSGDYVYAIFPAALLAAYRFGPPGATAATLVVSAVAVAVTVAGRGMFVTSTPTNNLFLLQTFIALLAVTAQGFAAAIAERQHAEHELRISGEHLAEAQAVAHLGSWYWDVGSDRLAWSDELYRIFGLVPRGISPTFEGFLERVHRDDRAHVETTIRQAMVEKEQFQFDERIVLPNGDVRVLESQGRVLRDPDGRTTTVQGICQDVSDARRSQEALAASEAKFAKIFHASPVAICLVALADGRVLDVNQRCVQMLGYERREDVVGKQPRSFGMWAEPGEQDRVLRELREQRSLPEAPVTYRTRGGVPRRAIVSLELIELAGEACGLALFWRL